MRSGNDGEDLMCRTEVLQFDKEKARETFLAYASGYDLSDVKVKLKVDHTLRVAQLCERIADSLGKQRCERACEQIPASGCEGSFRETDDFADRNLAWMCGLLHDIGRFEQLRIYHTFRDAVSVDHAQLSADLLFKDGMIRSFLADDGQDALIEKAIRLHNAFLLPETLTVQERTLCQILRDADKIDILRVNRETPMTQIYDLPEEAFLTAGISEEVFEDILAHSNVNRVHSKTAIDFLMGHIAFVFGLVYPESFRIVKQQGYLDQMLAFESRNEKTRRQMQQVREEVYGYIREKGC